MPTPSGLTSTFDTEALDEATLDAAVRRVAGASWMPRTGALQLMQKRVLQGYPRDWVSDAIRAECRRLTHARARA